MINDVIKRSYSQDNRLNWVQLSESVLHALVLYSSFDAGYPEKLYQGLSGGVSTFNALSSYSNTNISDIMNSWITQAGHPLLTVNINYDTETVTLTQVSYIHYITII